MSIDSLDKPSLAREFYHGLVNHSNPSEAIKALVRSDPPTFETEWRDFKGAERTPGNDIKRIWSEALTGFANTQGGVLIWGIDARKDPATGIDATSGLSLVPDPAALKSRLNELHGQATDPPVLGVEIEAYSITGTSGPGFVLCFVPESPFRPHRAEYANRQYLIRAGDDFRTASVSLLRNLFFPQTRCCLIPTLKPICFPRNGRMTCRFDGFLENRGSATAFDTFVKVDYEPHGTSSMLKEWNTGPVLRPYHAASKLPIHPGVSTQFLSIGYEQLNFPPEYRFKIQIYAQDAEPVEWLIVFTDAEARSGSAKIGNRKSLFT
jgi:Schlafen, AlbA_2